MNEELLKQNKMLQQYIAALQRQNNSRNTQKDILLQQIDNLNKDIDNFKFQIVNSNRNNQNIYQIDVLNRHKQNLQIEIRHIHGKLEQIKKLNNEFEIQNSKLKNQINNLNSRLLTYQYKPINNTNDIQLSKLKIENNELKNKNNNLQLKQLEIQKLNRLNIELKKILAETEQKYKSQIKLKEYNKTEVDYDKIKQEIGRQYQLQKQQQIKQEIGRQYQLQKQQQIKIVRNNYQSIIQTKNKLIKQLQSKLNENQNKIYQAQKNYTFQLTQLKNVKYQLQSKLNISENQRMFLQEKLKKLQTQFLNKALRSNKVNQQKYQTQIQALKNKLKRKSQLQIFQLGEQKKIFAQNRKQNEQLKKIIFQINLNNKTLIEQLRHIKQNQQMYFKNQSSSLPSHLNKQESLKDVVQQLKKQLKSVKSQFKRLEEDNKRRDHYLNNKNIQLSNLSQSYQSPSFNLNYDKKHQSQIHPDFRNSIPTNSKILVNKNRPQASPVLQQGLKFTKLKNQAEKFRLISNRSPRYSEPIQPDKWQTLQKRITHLKEENMQLKSSLYI